MMRHGRNLPPPDGRGSQYTKEAHVVDLADDAIAKFDAFWQHDMPIEGEVEIIGLGGAITWTKRGNRGRDTSTASRIARSQCLAQASHLVFLVAALSCLRHERCGPPARMTGPPPHPLGSGAEG